MAYSLWVLLQTSAHLDESEVCSWLGTVLANVDDAYRAGAGVSHKD